MRRASSLPALLALGLLAGCEEGPDQIYKPNPPNFDPNLYNGLTAKGIFHQGDQPFQVKASGQKSGTVKICEADELAKRWTAMVNKPILPTHGAGGIDLRGQPEWSGLTIDAAQQTLCQAYVYYDGLSAWGDNAELIAFYDTKTRVIDRLATLTGYEGNIAAGPYVIANNAAVTKSGKPIANELGGISDDDLREMNIELLKTYRKEIVNPEQRDCVALGSCYSMDWYTMKRFIFNDVQIDFATDPLKKVNHIGINLGRNFDFGKGNVKFEMTPTPAAGLPPMPRIAASTTCHPTLGDTWDHIKQNCLGIDPEAKALTRPVFGNEAMYADMGGLSMYMVRPSLAADAIIPDGERPQATDVIVGMGFNTSYEGKLAINRNALFGNFFGSLVAKVQTVVPTVDVTAKLTALRPAGDAALMPLGTQKVTEAGAETTLTLRAAQIVQTAVKAATGSVPAELKDPNFYVEVLIREMLALFNEGTQPDPTSTYFFFGDDTAEVLYGRMTRKIGNERYSVTAVYHNKSDQLLTVFFKRGLLRTEDVLHKNADLASKGVFSLNGLINSKALGLLTPMKPKDATAVKTAMQRALITVNVTPPVDVLVAYHPKDGLSGYSIPVKGQLDRFVSAAYYGFSGNNVGAAFWTGDLDEETRDVVLAISSGSFYDKVTFCGQKVGIFDSVTALLKAVPASCEKIVTYSSNGKLVSSVSTYVTTGTPTVGLRLYVTADRIDGAYYWAE